MTETELNPAEFGPHVPCVCVHDRHEDHDAPWGCVRCACQHWPPYGPDAKCVCADKQHEHAPPYGCTAPDCVCRWFPVPVEDDDQEPTDITAVVIPAVPTAALLVFIAFADPGGWLRWALWAVAVLAAVNTISELRWFLAERGWLGSPGFYCACLVVTALASIATAGNWLAGNAHIAWVYVTAGAFAAAAVTTVLRWRGQS